MSDREINWLHERLGGIETPELNGDNLAILLCTFFDDPDEEQDDNGWSLSAVKGCDSILDAIRKHYAPALERLIRERDEARAARMEAEREIGQLQMRLIGEEARGYRRGVQDAAKTIGEALESPVEQRCCGIGISVYGGPPECCNNPISLVDGDQARAAILALLERTEPGEKK